MLFIVLFCIWRLDEVLGRSRQPPRDHAVNKHMLRQVLHWRWLINLQQAHLVNKLKGNYRVNEQFEVETDNSINQNDKHNQVEQDSEQNRTPNLLHLHIKVNLHVSWGIVKNRIFFFHFDGKSVVPVVYLRSPNLTEFVRSKFFIVYIVCKNQAIEVSINCSKTIVSSSWLLFKL